jgi:hypothetical protein
MRREHARCFHAEPGRNAGHQHALAAQIHAFQHFIGGRSGTKYLAHRVLRFLEGVPSPAA